MAEKITKLEAEVVDLRAEIDLRDRTIAELAEGLKLVEEHVIRIMGSPRVVALLGLQVSAPG